MGGERSASPPKNTGRTSFWFGSVLCYFFDVLLLLSSFFFFLLLLLFLLRLLLLRLLLLVLPFGAVFVVSCFHHWTA